MGLSELFAKVGEDPEVSGWGIELTMRVARSDREQGPPPWSLNLLNKLGEYVYSNGRVVAPGHRMDPGGPITGQPGTALTALVFAADPQVPAVSTPFGRVDLVAVVGVSAQELARAQAARDATDIVAELQVQNPLLVTDPAR